MTVVDLVFPVVGTRLPCDHNYHLYASLSRLLPCLHDGTLDYSLVPVTGRYIGRGQLELDAGSSRLGLRVAVADIHRVLPLAGKRLEVLGANLRLGVPRVHALRPTPILRARTVTIKHATEVGSFLQVSQRQLDALGIGGRLRVPEHVRKNGQSGPLRRVMRIKDKRIVCFSLCVEGLQPEESLRLQEVGLGGRRHQGCGVFLPVRQGGAT